MKTTDAHTLKALRASVCVLEALQAVKGLTDEARGHVIMARHHALSVLGFIQDREAKNTECVILQFPAKE